MLSLAQPGVLGLVIMNIDKLRWFIIGNLVGFILLICGVLLNEKIKARFDASPASPGMQTDSGSSADTNEIDSTAHKVERVTVRHDVQKGTLLTVKDVALCAIEEKERLPVPSRMYKTLWAKYPIRT